MIGNTEYTPAGGSAPPDQHSGTDLNQNTLNTGDNPNPPNPINPPNPHKRTTTTEEIGGTHFTIHDESIICPRCEADVYKVGRLRLLNGEDCPIANHIACEECYYKYINILL